MSAVNPGLKFINLPDGGAPKAGDMAVAVRSGIDTLVDISPGSSNTGLAIQITQVAHGFSFGQVLRVNNVGVYVLSQADNAADADAVGIISGIVNANIFELQFAGIVTGFIGLTIGSDYFLSPTVAGAITVTAPTTPGQIVKPLLIANTVASGFWLNYQGQQL